MHQANRTQKKHQNMKKLSTLLFLLIFGLNIQAQTGDGTIMGYVYGPDSTTVMPFATVYIDYNGSKLGVQSGLDGKYKISAVKPGTYNLHAELSMNGKASITGVNVYSESIAKQNLYLSGNDTLTVVVVRADKLLKDDHISTISLADIKNSPNIQNPKQMVVDMNSDVKLDQNNQMIIRGSRPGDVVYFVDGVKQRDMQSIPGAAISSMSVYTGGIPAKYGDTTGGVVIMNTKGYFDLYYAWKARQ